MTKLLCVSDEIEPKLYSEGVRDLAPDLVVACGDLPFDYLEFLVTMLNVPLVYVPGNHDPDMTRPQRPEVIGDPTLDPLDSGEIFGLPGVAPESAGPRGCTNADGRLVDAAGLTLAGLGGSIRYSEGPNQYDEAEMGRRVRGLVRRAWLRRLRGRGGVDVLLTHSPPLGLGDADDPPHRGFAALHRAIDALSPRLLVHGHVHPYGEERPDRRHGNTEIVNAVPHRVVEI